MAQRDCGSGAGERDAIRAASAITQHGNITLDYTPFLEDGGQNLAPRSAWGKRRAARRIVYRRFGVLAAAIAVPAMAAPQLEAEPEPQVIRFVIPQTIPYQPPAEEPAFASEAQEAAEDPAAGIESTAFPYRPGPSARAFTLSGSFTSRMRAEECLTMAIYYEAASEGIPGKRAVAQVVMNRVQHPAFPNSVCGVVFQGSERTTGCQFSFTCDGSLARKPETSVWLRAKRVASAALGGFVYEPVGLATHYHTHAVNPYWAASLDPVGVVGAHRFYRWKGANGQRAAFSAQHTGYEQGPSFNLGAIRSARIPETISAAPVPAMPAPANSLPPATQSLNAAPAPADNAGSIALPGTVLEQHRSSGQWLREPGTAPR